MLTCPYCRRRLLHVRRTLVEKIWSTEVYACAGCRKRIGARRVSLLFLFSKCTRCIECGSAEIARLAKPDRVDAFTTNPLGLAQRLLNAPVCRCSPCRVQFYDWRPIASPRPRD